jgi:hypothetical protein
MKMGMMEKWDADYDARMRLLNYCKKIEHMESTHEESWIGSSVKETDLSTI